MLVFDITNRESFSHISGWFEDAAMNMKCRSPSFILVGQKADLASAREVCLCILIPAILPVRDP
ncbi:unnamed protein product [Dibothriocephalus latus]|uniref:Uncharacterized protein n=1 Tax=Dibothriocephalus latus TaxID=60516 RepID=A0A3P7LE64_DIBLA|nr:unnamed protein product [Dibothriocephalus latus]